MIRENPKIHLNDILPKCDFDDAKAVLDNNICSKGVEPLNCRYKKYWEDHTYCGIELPYKEKLQELYAKWLEQ